MSTNESPALPPGIDLLWGRRARGGRGPRAELSVDAIAAAASALADREGLGAVSMARVAAELGFSTMSLYRHVANKDELLQLMWNASAAEIDEYEPDGEDWRERLRSWALAQRAALDRHPWITQLPMAAPPLGPSSLAFVEIGLAALDGSGLDDEDALQVIGLLSSYTLSEARMAQDTRRAVESGAPETAWTFEALLRELVDESTYPRLHRLAWSAAGGEEAAPEDADYRQFLFGVDCILDGVQSLVDRG